jgi:hypothetical protein
VVGVEEGLTVADLLFRSLALNLVFILIGFVFFLEIRVASFVEFE